MQTQMESIFIDKLPLITLHLIYVQGSELRLFTILRYYMNYSPWAGHYVIGELIGCSRLETPCEQVCKCEFVPLRGYQNTAWAQVSFSD